MCGNCSNDLQYLLFANPAFIPSSPFCKLEDGHRLAHVNTLYWFSVLLSAVPDVLLCSQVGTDTSTTTLLAGSWETQSSTRLELAPAKSAASSSAGPSMLCSNRPLQKSLEPPNSQWTTEIENQRSPGPYTADHNQNSSTGMLDRDEIERIHLIFRCCSERTMAIVCRTYHGRWNGICFLAKNQAWSS